MHTAAVLLLIVEVALVVKSTQPYGTLSNGTTRFPTTMSPPKSTLPPPTTNRTTIYNSPLCPVQYSAGRCDCTLEFYGWAINCSDSDLQQMPVITSEYHPIKRLVLSSNKITFISAGQFNTSAPIFELWIDGNRLRNADFLSSPVFFNLTVLILANNLGLMPPRKDLLMYKYQLEILDLKGTKITSLSFLEGLRLDNLQRIFLGSNPLSSINMGTFQGFPNLNYLDLSRCDLSSLDFLGSSSLSKLEELSLKGNRITEITVDHVRSLRALQLLQVSNNDIGCLKQEVLDALPSITIFDWHDNPVSCDCDLSWLSSWKGVYINSPAAGCSTTEEMSGSTSDYISKPNTSQATAKPSSIHLEYIIPPIAAAVIVIVVVAAVVVFMVRRKRPEPPERYVEAPLHNLIERTDTQKSTHEYESIGSTVLAGEYLEPVPLFDYTAPLAPQTNHHYTVIGDNTRNANQANASAGRYVDILPPEKYQHYTAPLAPQTDHLNAVIGDNMTTADQRNASAASYVDILPSAKYQGRQLPTNPLPQSMEQHMAGHAKQDIETEPLYETIRGQNTHYYSSPVSSAGAQQHSRGGAVNAGYLEP